jgi:hypothetical protein
MVRSLLPSKVFTGGVVELLIEEGYEKMGNYFMGGQKLGQMQNVVYFIRDQAGPSRESAQGWS